MEIIQIYEQYLYSVKYDSCIENEYDRLFNDEWCDIASIVTFMHENKKYLGTGIWTNVADPFSAAQKVARERAALQYKFKELLENTKRGIQPDLDSHFHFLDGQYYGTFTLTPMKSYGTENPSFLRIYAIKVDTNSYIITGGGIKLCKTIQDSPGLKDHVIKNIDKVRNYLLQNGIETTGDI